MHFNDSMTEIWNYSRPSVLEHNPFQKPVREPKLFENRNWLFLDWRQKSSLNAFYEYILGVWSILAAWSTFCLFLFVFSLFFVCFLLVRFLFEFRILFEFRSKNSSNFLFEFRIVREPSCSRTKGSPYYSITTIIWISDD